MIAHGNTCLRSIAATLLAGFLLLATATSLYAQQLSPPPQTCTTLNCGALSLPGRINGHPATPAIAIPWVTQIAGRANGCMRFQLTAESKNLAMSVVAPDGAVFTNDNGAVPACPSCPLVVVGAARNGFFTIVIGTANGLSAEASFTLSAGLYNTGNSPNCNNPTTPR